MSTTTGDVYDGSANPDLPPKSPLAPILIIFIAGLLIAFFIAMRNCCTKQMLSHHMYKKIARGGGVNGNGGGGGTIRVNKEGYLPVSQQPPANNNGSSNKPAKQGKSKRKIRNMKLKNKRK